MTYPFQSGERPLVEVLVRPARPQAIETVMVAGRLVMHQGRFLRVDREEVLAEIARKLGAPAHEAARPRAVARELLPHVRAFYSDW